MIRRLLTFFSSSTGNAGRSRLPVGVNGEAGLAAVTQWATRHRERLLIAAILLVAALAHGINMFDFPYYENDEGTYMAQAWAVVEQGRLAPYTYWYDHAPGGWLLIALWAKLSGGFDTFGMAVNSGRVLMLLLQVAATFMLYRIARSISGSVVVGAIAALTFALSAYGIYFHRRVLIDNIAAFWMLLSIYPLVTGRLTLLRVWLSALAMGIAVLSKEPIVFLFPVLAYLVFYRAHSSHRWFATIGWAAISGLVVSLYVLMALLKNELFPSGTLLGGTSQHVSLIGTLRFFSCQGQDDGGILDPNSNFWQLVGTWVRQDPFLVIGGSAAAVVSVLTIKRYRLAGIMGLATLALWAFLARGGLIRGFYLVPVVPLLALNAGLVYGSAANWLRRLLENRIRLGAMLGKGGQVAALAICLGLCGLGYVSSDLGFRSDPYVLWNSDQAYGQRQALEWVRTNIPSDKLVVTDNYLWTDLNGTSEADGQQDTAFRSEYSSYYYWPVAQDPEIRNGTFDGDWRSIDYLVSTSQMHEDAREFGLALVVDALEYSRPVAQFDTGGFNVTVHKVDKTRSPEPSVAPSGGEAAQQCEL